MVMVMTTHTQPAIDRTIYPMPMFVNLVVSNLADASALYEAAGFFTLATIPGPEGETALVHLRREKYQDILMTHGEPIAGTVTASFAAGDVDLQEVADRVRAAGGDAEGPFDTAWFSHDVIVRDADGNAITLTAPRMQDAEQARAWAHDTIQGDFERDAAPAR